MAVTCAYLNGIGFKPEVADKQKSKVIQRSYSTLGHIGSNRNDVVGYDLFDAAKGAGVPFGENPFKNIRLEDQKGDFVPHRPSGIT
jgi:hypothetical protein